MFLSSNTDLHEWAIITVPSSVVSKSVVCFAAEQDALPVAPLQNLGRACGGGGCEVQSGRSNCARYKKINFPIICVL